MRFFYRWRYFTGKTPWDTNITPPELVQLVESEGFRAGHALDLGCGTGTNAIYLAKHGFEVTGVDYVGHAIETARGKARALNAQIDFRVADVLAPGLVSKPFDLILDIGCFHSLDPDGRMRYAANIRSWTRQGSLFLVYAFFPFRTMARSLGVSRSEIEKLFCGDFELRAYAADDTSAWYRWERN